MAGPHIASLEASQETRNHPAKFLTPPKAMIVFEVPPAPPRWWVGCVRRGVCLSAAFFLSWAGQPGGAKYTSNAMPGVPQGLGRWVPGGGRNPRLRAARAHSQPHPAPSLQPCRVQVGPRGR